MSMAIIFKPVPGLVYYAIIYVLFFFWVDIPRSRKDTTAIFQTRVLKQDINILHADVLFTKQSRKDTKTIAPDINVRGK